MVEFLYILQVLYGTDTKKYNTEDLEDAKSLQIWFGKLRSKGVDITTFVDGDIRLIMKNKPTIYDDTHRPVARIRYNEKTNSFESYEFRGDEPR